MNLTDSSIKLDREAEEAVKSAIYGLLRRVVTGLLLKPFNKVLRSADIDGPVFDQCLLYQVPYLLVKIKKLY